MKISVSEDKFDRIDIILHCALFVALPVSVRLTSWVVWLLLTIWLLRRGLKNRVKYAVRSKSVWVLAMPVFYMITTLLYTEQFSEGIRSLENKFFLVVFPVIMSSAVFTQRKINTLLRGYTISIFCWSLVCLTMGLYNFFSADASFANMAGDVYNRVVSPWGFLTNIKLVEPISLSPIYMSMFVGLAVFICLYLYNESKASPRQRFAIAILILYFLIFDLLLGARMGIIALFFAWCFYIVKFLLKNHTKGASFLKVSGFLILLLLLTSLLIYNPVLQKRFLKDFAEHEIPEEVDGWNSVNLRSAIWRCSIGLIKERPLLGYGIGALDTYRENCYQQYSFYGVFGTDLNSHNQYLEYLMIGGFPLLLILLISLAYSYYQAKSMRSGLFQIFILFLAMNMLTESLLNVQKGLIFYSYFCSLFMFGLRFKHLTSRHIA
ncbi:MAG TPA: O-antigen ligase family protein [Ohtaekwangia sp.]|nr:O-antigen ligase family protein [Ohtaekwangia sp.]